MPSLYEGFCLPMVEAMACGIPTVAANSSCLPEISGGVLRYFDPYSVDEMTVCMEEVLQSSDLRAELIGRGKQRAQQFSWELCAQQTLDVVEQVARTVKVKARAARVAL
jgi:glycosyltransferase involved in cell wall biosynthesis